MLSFLEDIPHFAHRVLVHRWQHMRVNIHAASPEQSSAWGQRLAEEGIGMYAADSEQLSA
jgi:hypothetical protein